MNDPDRVSKRDLSNSVHYNYFEKRKPKTIEFYQRIAKYQTRSPPFDSSDIAVNVSLNFLLKVIPCCGKDIR